MFKKRTLFIVGAGASFEFGLPTGPALAKGIASIVDFKTEGGAVTRTNRQQNAIGEFIYRAGGKRTNYIQAGHQVRDGIQQCFSIDDFLDVHAKNAYIQEMGKMAIVSSILNAERSSKLFFDKSNFYNRMSFARFEDTWIVKLIRMLARGVPAEDKENLFNNISFVVFNYDRCIEHVLTHAVKHLYNINEDDALKVFNKATVIHPYGSVAPFKFGNQQGIPFGGDSHDSWDAYIDVASLASRVRTYTEQSDDPSELHALHQEMVDADTIVFLGFGFHDQNMALLRPEGRLDGKRVFATAYGMSDSDVELVKAQLGRFFEINALMTMGSLNRIQIRNDLTCTQLFDAYSKSLPGD